MVHAVCKLFTIFVEHFSIIFGYFKIGQWYCVIYIYPLFVERLAKLIFFPFHYPWELDSLNPVDPDKVDELEVCGFICTTFTLNILFFILTALKICQVKKEMHKLTGREDSFRHQAKFNTAKGK